jgi:Na+/H+ antiporter NhaD/arsenite permease-like protein
MSTDFIPPNILPSWATDLLPAWIQGWAGNDLTQVGVVAVFAIVYLGMFFGGLPHVRLDRTGVALLGAIAMIALTGMGLDDAARSVDLPTLVLLFAFMVVSAQMRLGGFYAAVTRAVVGWPLRGPALLAAVLLVAAVLSAVFSNDVVCLAMTPLVARLCLQRGLDAVRFLIGLACAANIGSAATLIGNPQNMLIGSVLQLPFAGYLAVAWLPVLLSLLALWAWLAFGPGAGATVVKMVGARDARETEPALDRLESAKGLLVATTLMVLFLFTDVNREVAALVGAGVLLLSRRLHSAEVMGTVDWPLLLLFIGLFIVNHAFAQTGLAAQAVQGMAAWGVHLEQAGTLLVLGSALSNLVSNVPAVMLLLPHLPAGDASGVLLALASTFAGNLLLVGSIANLIVVGLAERAGVVIDWKQHARIGIPVTLLSLALLWFCWQVLGIQPPPKVSS